MKTKLLFVTIALLGTQFINSQIGLDFNANLKVAILNIPYTLPANYTLEAQFMSPLPTTTSTYNTLFKGNSNHPILTENNILGAYDNGGTNFRSTGYDMTTLSAGWHHIAVVCTGGSSTFYIDGDNVGTIAYQSTNNIVTFGNIPNVGGGQQFGMVDEVRIWNIARLQTEIQNDMNNCLIGNETGLVAYYSFEADSGTGGFTDVTGNGWNGYLANMDVDNDWITGFACTSLGTDAFEKGAIFSMYPNPSSGTLHIKTEVDGVFTITNLLGQTVSSFKVSSNIEKSVSVENLANGIYFIKGNDEQNIGAKKLIIKH